MVLGPVKTSRVPVLPLFDLIISEVFCQAAKAIPVRRSNRSSNDVGKTIGATVGVFGPTSYPLSLNGSGYNFGTFDDGATDGQIRLGSSSGNTINGTFGGFNATNGIYVEINIVNPAIRIDTVTLTFN